MQILLDFVNALGSDYYGEVHTDKVTRALYSTDASIYQMEPKAVIVPRDSDALKQAVSTAMDHGLPITARGSGSSLAGQAIGAGVIIDTTKYLTKIDKTFVPESKSIKVEPGVILADVNRFVGKYGLMFGPDPASAERATIGGVIGNNAAGAHSIAYGLTADHIVSAEIIRSDGTLALWDNAANIKNINSSLIPLLNYATRVRSEHTGGIKDHWPITWRNSAGFRLNYLLPWSASKPAQWIGEYPSGDHENYNLAALIAGSEGSLGVLTSATLNLVDKPKYKVLGLIAYSSVAEASEAVPELLKTKPSAVELIPDNLVALARTVPAYADKVAIFTVPAKAYLAVEFSGADKKSLESLAQALPRVFAVVTEPGDQEKIWAARKVGLGLFDSASIKKRPIAFIEDCAIPVENLATFVRELEIRFEKDQVSAAYYAHASAGCLHIRPMLDMKSGLGRELLRSIADFTKDLAISLGGTMSSEHGDGILRGEYIKDIYGAETYDLMRELKSLADPKGLMNPGKIIDTPPMDEGLRDHAKIPEKNWEPALSFDLTGGLVNTIEKCNGQGVCRKSSGVMCPSFQVTKDEVFSTRGRSNLLREYIYQRADEDGIGLKDIKATLDLCLACKGCKSECPSRVDVAKLKTEFLNYYHQIQAPSLRDKIFANFPKLLRVFSKVPLLFKLGVGTINSLSFARTWLGVAEQRQLPVFGQSRVSSAGMVFDPDRETVILAGDAYTTYLEPEIGIKASLVLDQLGYNVIPLQLDGFGRTYLSKGFVDGAKKHLRASILELITRDPQHKYPIIGLEPSEINILREEIFDLKVVEEDVARKIADRAFFIDEFISRINDVKLDAQAQQSQQVIVHGHCHQKAAAQMSDGLAVGVDATKLTLEKFGYSVEVLPTGCCGMAGAFGFEKEHYEFSNKVGEMVLFPALRDPKNSKKLICSPGTSCRTQIKDGVSQDGHHTVEFIYARLMGEPLPN